MTTAPTGLVYRNKFLVYFEFIGADPEDSYKELLGIVDTKAQVRELEGDFQENVDRLKPLASCIHAQVTHESGFYLVPSS